MVFNPQKWIVHHRHFQHLYWLVRTSYPNKGSTFSSLLTCRWTLVTESGGFHWPASLVELVPSRGAGCCEEWIGSQSPIPPWAAKSLVGSERWRSKIARREVRGRWAGVDRLAVSPGSLVTSAQRLGPSGPVGGWGLRGGRSFCVSSGWWWEAAEKAWCGRSSLAFLRIKDCGALTLGGHRLCCSCFITISCWSSHQTQWGRSYAHF